MYSWVDITNDLIVVSIQYKTNYLQNSKQRHYKETFFSQDVDEYFYVAKIYYFLFLCTSFNRRQRTFLASIRLIRSHRLWDSAVFTSCLLKIAPEWCMLYFLNFPLSISTSPLYKNPYHTHIYPSHETLSERPMLNIINYIVITFVQLIKSSLNYKIN